MNATTTNIISQNTLRVCLGNTLIECGIDPFLAGFATGEAMQYGYTRAYEEDRKAERNGVKQTIDDFADNLFGHMIAQITVSIIDNCECEEGSTYDAIEEFQDLCHAFMLAVKDGRLELDY